MSSGTTTQSLCKLIRYKHGQTSWLISVGLYRAAVSVKKLLLVVFAYIYRLIVHKHLYSVSQGKCYYRSWAWHMWRNGFASCPSIQAWSPWHDHAHFQNTLPLSTSFCHSLRASSFFHTQPPVVPLKGGSDALLWPLWATVVMCTNPYIHIYMNKNKPLKVSFQLLFQQE